MDLRRDTFQAIADPTRRQIIELLTRQPLLPVNAIAEQFDVTRQAVSLHVRILHECGLIAIRKQGRERYCEVKLERLDEVSNWIEYNRRFWKDKFRSLDNYLENQKNKDNDHEQI